MKQHHVIYVPGILDNIYHIQSTAVKFWRLYGVRGHFHAMPWRGDEKYGPKFQRLLDEINTHTAQGDIVSLVGASAGASAVVNAYTAMPDKINGIILICPKINHPEAVSQKTYSNNPAFKESLKRLQVNLSKLTVDDRKTKIITYYSPVDKTVVYKDVVIPGVEERRLPAIGHGRAIVYAITFGAPGLMSSLKRYKP